MAVSKANQRTCSSALRYECRWLAFAIGIEEVHQVSVLERWFNCYNEIVIKNACRCKLPVNVSMSMRLVSFTVIPGVPKK